jgi:lipid-A-disaccharide synthase
MSNLTWWIGNLLVDMPYIGLANIVAEKKVVPELLQNEANPDKIAETALKYLQDTTYYSSVKESLSRIRDKLGDPGAGRRVAESIADELYQSQSESKN